MIVDQAMYVEGIRLAVADLSDELAALPIPLTRTLIMATAIATRDYQDVHHDPALAVERGSPDIFMNIITTNGFAGRYVTDWAGPEALLRSVKIRLGAPNYPGDTMVIKGKVIEVNSDAKTVDVEVGGKNGLGYHLTGTVTVALP